MKVYYITGMIDTNIHGVVYKKKMNSDLISLDILDSPGKGKRRKEKFLNDFQSTVDDLAYEIYRKGLPGEAFILLGYSMGSYLSYELYYVLKEKYNIEPKYIVFMGMEFPDKNIMAKIHKRPSGTMVYRTLEELQISKQLLDSHIYKDVMKIIKHDLEIYKKYHYNSKDCKIQCPISIFYGTKEYDYPYESVVLPMMQGLFEKKVHVVSFDDTHIFGATKITEIKSELEKIILKMGG